MDWELMAELRWTNTGADGDRLRRRQAELLARGSVPLLDVVGFAVRTDKTQLAVTGLLEVTPFAKLPVLVRPGFYYVGKP